MEFFGRVDFGLSKKVVSTFSFKDYADGAQSDGFERIIVGGRK
jgi:hypothetical protein